MEDPKQPSFAVAALLWFVAIIVVGGIAYYAFILPFIALLQGRS